MLDQVHLYLANLSFTFSVAFLILLSGFALFHVLVDVVFQKVFRGTNDLPVLIGLGGDGADAVTEVR
ncbi:Uncharacterised protein [Mycobacterium tuberculosis]|nr:Uncharacterised protein [Mycobacterium tuberculosis]